jgi:hypothetical protein
VQIQKLVMAAFGAACLLLAGAMAAALFASPTVMAGVHGAFWFMAKVVSYLYAFLWFRFTFPRYRFDQLMRLGWRFLIPLALVNVIDVGVAIILRQQLGWSPFWAMLLMTLVTLGVAMWLASEGAKTEDAKPEAALQPADTEL